MIRLPKVCKVYPTTKDPHDLHEECDCFDYDYLEHDLAYVAIPQTVQPCVINSVIHYCYIIYRYDIEEHYSDDTDFTVYDEDKIPSDAHRVVVWVTDDESKVLERDPRLMYYRGKKYVGHLKWEPWPDEVEEHEE